MKRYILHKKLAWDWTQHPSLGKCFDESEQQCCDVVCHSSFNFTPGQRA